MREVPGERGSMNEPKMSRERLERRRDEILEQLGEGSREVRRELDRDPEEQAIQVEHHDVSIGIVENLRRELADIEDRLLEFEAG
jgi:RNA polymerase-binding transcription factor DksA